MSNPIVTQTGTELTVSSDALAEGMELEHRQVIRAVRNYMDNLERFGRVDFENQPFATAGGTQVREVAHLTEPQATFLLTSFRNIGRVAEFKVKLVQEFYRMRQALTGPALTADDVSRKQLALMILESEDAREAAEARVAELEPKAGAWDDLASGVGDYSVGDAAKMLARAGIETGRDRLFATLHEFGWVFRQSGRFQARQTAVDSGYLRQKPQSHLHPETREVVLDAPQIRVTLRGLERLRVRLGSVLHAVEAVAS